MTLSDTSFLDGVNVFRSPPVPMDRIKEIAFQTCKGACSDYIQRYLRDHQDTTWEQLKKELTSRFGEITDPQHASTLLRQLKQKGDESVQIYAENLLNLANEAYSDLDGNNEAIERELVGIFIDGLAHSYLKMKLMRENPATFSLAVKSAMTEQNLRKRFTLRTERVDEPRYKTTRPMTLTRPRRTEPLNSHEPMEIDHYRDAKRCYSCGKVGHVSRDCRSGGNLRQINAVEMQTYHGNSGRNREINCYSCGRVGHIARDCRSKGTYRQVNAVETQQYQGNSGRNNEIVCYQCNQRGHIRPNCPNRKPRTVNMVENWGAPNSTLIKFQNQRYRALVDSGASVSLIHKRIFETLRDKPKLLKKTANLQSVNGGSLHVEGCANLTFKIGSTKVTQLFYVVRDMNRNVILGKDWLVQNGVRLYFDLGCLRIQKNYVPLEEDINVASVVRLTVNAVLKPQSINVCPVGLKNNPSFGSTKLLEISPVASGYVSTEPGLMISNTVVNFNKNRKFPLMIVNNTNKSIRLKRGCVVGKASHLEEINLVNVNQSQGTSGLKKLDESEISVPQEFKKDILRMIRDNEDVFATSDKDLGCTDTVQMTIDTGNNPPIRLKPYRAPLNQREIIDRTIEELLEAKIIRKSRVGLGCAYHYCFKKDKTSRMCVDYRRLNAISKIYSFPLPLIDDLLASVGKAKVMTSLDLKSGYYQVKVKGVR
ncbi:unnamed protein product [Mytilus edulis]|uniref:CCHC-type domain-containing protein n=1 Tax=Mytilus edulis TaxID=6550 RepID=A0A8S3VN72_MYTED|nr:unnamed protein product [Mytilus edulis]